MVDKHTQGGEGDFHLHFEEFDILADAKNYKKTVPITEREKIKNDLLKNEHIHFAWLVSLNTPIDKFDRSPIMYEWINTGQCIVYINNLLSFEDPSKMLRAVWFSCKELHKLIDDVNLDVSELTTLKERQFKIHDKIKEMRKNIRELNTTMNTSKNIIQHMDDQLKEILETETNKIVEFNFGLLDNWWNEHIILTSEDVKLVSTDIWTKFKTENKDCVKNLEITSEKFKQFIKTKMPMNSLKEVSKKGAYEITGVRFSEKQTIIKHLKKQNPKEININTEVYSNELIE
jgi:hypothetical protein